MKKKIGAFSAGQFSLGTLVGGRPGTTIFQNPVGGGAGGCRIQGPGPAAPPCSAEACPSPSRPLQPAHKRVLVHKTRRQKNSRWDLRPCERNKRGGGGVSNRVTVLPSCPPPGRPCQSLARSAAPPPINLCCIGGILQGNAQLGGGGAGQRGLQPSGHPAPNPPPPPPCASTLKVTTATVRWGPRAWTRSCLCAARGTKRRSGAKTCPHQPEL